MDSGRLDDAKKMIESYFPDKKKSQYKDFAIGLFHMHKGEYELSIPHLLSFIENSNQVEDIIKTTKILGLAYIRIRKLKEAYNLFSGLNNEYQEDPDIQNMLAYIDYINGKINIAFRRYCQVLRYHPKNLTAINAVSYCMIDYFNQPYEALQMIKPYINEDPMILDTVGWAYFKLGKFDEALNYTMKAFEKLPANKEIKEHINIISQKIEK